MRLSPIAPYALLRGDGTIRRDALRRRNCITICVIETKKKEPGDCSAAVLMGVR
jgi:hypothetical protein